MVTESAQAFGKPGAFRFPGEKASLPPAWGSAVGREVIFGVQRQSIVPVRLHCVARSLCSSCPSERIQGFREQDVRASYSYIGEKPLPVAPDWAGIVSAERGVTRVRGGELIAKGLMVLRDDVPAVPFFTMSSVTRRFSTISALPPSVVPALSAESGMEEPNSVSDVGGVPREVGGDIYRPTRNRNLDRKRPCGLFVAR